MYGIPLKWVIIGAIFCIVIVLMGKNPVEEREQERERAMEGKDRLVESIKEHNAKSNTGVRSMMGAAASGRPVAPPQRAPYPSYMMNQGNNTAYPQNNYAPRTTAPTARGSIPQEPEQPESYYPPPPTSSGR